MLAEYETVKLLILDELEEITSVKAPAWEYLRALEEIRDTVAAWFDASIEAAKDDLKRAGK
jgi:hypothetical protein